MAIRTVYRTTVQVLGSPRPGVVTIRRPNNRVSDVLVTELRADGGKREIEEAIAEATKPGVSQPGG